MTKKDTKTTMKAFKVFVQNFMGLFSYTTLRYQVNAHKVYKPLGMTNFMGMVCFYNR